MRKHKLIKIFTGVALSVAIVFNTFMAAYAQTTDVEIVKNGTFEGGNVAGYYSYGSTSEKATLIASDEEARSGKYSMKVADRTQKWSAYAQGIVNKDGLFEKNGEYIYKAYLKLPEELANVEAKVFVQYRYTSPETGIDAKGNPKFSAQKIFSMVSITGSDWVEISGEFKLPVDVDKVEICLKENGEGNPVLTSFYVDDISLKKKYVEPPKTSKVEIASVENGSIVADKETAVAGEIINVTVTPDDGYKIVAGSIKLNGIAFIDSKFTMPNSDVVVSAEFEKESTETLTDPSSSDETYVGINLGPYAPYASEFIVKDLFKIAAEWKCDSLDLSDISLDEHGWIKEVKENQKIYTTINPDAKPGKYVVLYEGTGDLNVTGDFVNVLDKKDNRIELEITKQSGKITVEITSVDTQDYIKNISFVENIYEDNFKEDPINPEFLENFKNFKEFRFMNTMKTNGSVVRTWDERPLVDDYTWITNGVPVEIMVELCNKAGNDGWFCMPHGADDEYVAKFAKKVNNLLDSDLKAYFELSNEAWNTQFDAYSYFLKKAEELELAVGEDESVRSATYYANRAVEMFKIWDDNFTDSDRLVKVLATKAVNQVVSVAILDCELSDGTKAYEHADAFAMAPYLGVSPSNFEIGFTKDDVLECLKVRVDSSVETIKLNYALATERGLKLLGYEGGQHANPNGDLDSTQAMIDANRDSEMAEIYGEYLDNWKEITGSKLMLFTSTKRPSEWGSWGLLEYQNQPAYEAPKYTAVNEWILKNPYDPTLIPTGPTETEKIEIKDGEATLVTEKIIIDGKLQEDLWSDGFISLEKYSDKSYNNETSFKLLWSEEGLYVGVKVKDDLLVNDSPKEHLDDSIELYIDPENNKTSKYGDFDYQIARRFNDEKFAVKKSGVVVTDKFKNNNSATSLDGDIYMYEFLLAWSDLGITEPKEGMKIGFDITNNDDDGNNIIKAQWSGDDNNWVSTQLYANVTLVKETIVVPIKYIVTIDSVEQKVEEGKTAIKPADPTKDGFTFKGWFVGEDEFDFTTEITEDVEITSKWDKVVVAPTEYTIKIDGVAQKVEEGKLAIKPQDPKKEGYTFAGWFVGDVEFDFTTEITGNLEVASKWKEVENTDAPETGDSATILIVLSIIAAMAGATLFGLKKRVR